MEQENFHSLEHPRDELRMILKGLCRDMEHKYAVSKGPTSSREKADHQLKTEELQR